MTRIVYYDRTRETVSGTPGTSTTVTLNGAVDGQVTFASHSDLTVGDTFYYLMEDQDDLDWEIGLGTWQGSNQFDRPSSVLSNSSGSTSKINFGANTQVALVFSADAIDDLRINEVNKSLVTSANVVAVFDYDTRNDTDGGAWRDKTRHTSWYNETLNTSTRGATRKFPKLARIVAETDRVTIYDMTRPDNPMWMVFNDAAGSMFRAFGNGSCIEAKGGTLAYGSTSNGLQVAKFIEDNGQRWIGVAGGSQTILGNISQRNNNLSTTSNLPRIVDSTVNDVAITTLTGSEIDVNTGLPFPSTIVGTAAGGSLINYDGSLANENNVVDFTGAVNIVSVDIGDAGFCILAASDKVYVYETAPAADIALTSADYIFDTAGTTGPHISGNIDYLELQTSDGAGNAMFVVGTSVGIFRVAYESGGSGSVITQIDKTYTSGSQVDDIRGCWLANSKTLDRSVKGNTLTENGTVTEGAVSTGAELQGYSAWSGSINLTRTSDTNWDTIGTGALSWILWFKCTGNSTIETLASIANAGNTIRFNVVIDTDGTVDFIIDGTTASVTLSSTAAFDSSSWHCVAGVHASTTSHTLYVDGNQIATSTTDTGSLTDTGNLPLALGVDADGSTNPATTSTLALVRLTAYAPTATQIKKIYEEEKFLFQANADCLLGGTTNVVQDLSYSSGTNELFVATTDGTSVFNGLRRVEYIDSTASHITSDDHKSVSATGEYYSIGTAAEAIGHNPERSLVENT